MISVMKLEDKHLCDSNFQIAVFGDGNLSLTELIVYDRMQVYPEDGPLHEKSGLA